MLSDQAQRALCFHLVVAGPPRMELLPNLLVSFLDSKFELELCWLQTRVLRVKGP